MKQKTYQETVSYAMFQARRRRYYVNIKLQVCNYATLSTTPIYISR